MREIRAVLEYSRPPEDIRIKGEELRDSMERDRQVTFRQLGFGISSRITFQKEFQRQLQELVTQGRVFPPVGRPEWWREGSRRELSNLIYEVLDKFSPAIVPRRILFPVVVDVILTLREVEHELV